MLLQTSDVVMTTSLFYEIVMGFLVFFQLIVVWFPIKKNKLLALAIWTFVVTGITILVTYLFHLMMAMISPVIYELLHKHRVIICFFLNGLSYYWKFLLVSLLLPNYFIFFHKTNICFCFVVDRGSLAVAFVFCCKGCCFILWGKISNMSKFVLVILV